MKNNKIYKIGRNEKCPCGSGKKYKHCHGGTNNRLEVRTEAQSHIENEFSSSCMAVPNLSKRIGESIFEKSESSQRWKEAVYESDKVEIIIDEIENAAYSLFENQKRSNHFLWSVARRAAPNLLRAIISGYSGMKDKAGLMSSEAILHISEFILNCGDESIEVEWFEKEGLRGLNIDCIDSSDVELITNLVVLGFMKSESKALYRLSTKKAGVFMKGQDVRTLQIRESIENYEKRRDEYETILGTIGMWYEQGDMLPKIEELCGFWTVIGVKDKIFTFNTRNPKESIMVKGEYLLSPMINYHRISKINFEKAFASVSYDKILEDYSEIFLKYYSFSGKKILSFLYTLFVFIKEETLFDYIVDSGFNLSSAGIDNPKFELGKRLNHTKRILEMGVIQSSHEEWVKKLFFTYEKLNHRFEIEHLSIEDIENIVSIFTYDSECKGENKPVLFVNLSQKSKVLDLLLSGNFYRYLFLTVNLADSNPNIKINSAQRLGKKFESNAKAFFLKKLDLNENRIAFDVKIKNGRDIDLAFVYERVLFMVECKAKAKKESYMNGVHARLRIRDDLFLKELTDKNMKRIELVKEGRVNSLIPPSSFDKSVSLICTSCVEYLDKGQKNYWIGSYPRVGTPEEILETIKYVASKRAY